MTRFSRLVCIFIVTASGCGDPAGPSAPPVVTKVSGDAQEVLWGQTEPTPLVVSVTDANGRAMPGVKVNWGVVSGGGTLSSVTSTTDESGNATVTWTLGQSGTQSVQAWTDIEGSQGVTFTAAAFTPVVSVVSGNGQRGPFDVTLPSPLVVSVTTPSGVPMPNMKVSWGVVSGQGTVSSASSTTDETGKASVTWTLGPLPNVNQSVKAWTDFASSQSAVFSAKGQKTLVLHYDGTAWTRSLSTEQYGIQPIAGWSASPSLAFVGGTNCPLNLPVLTDNNGVWTGMDSCLGGITVTSLWGTSPTDIWAVGTGTLGSLKAPHTYAWLFHSDGHAWTTPFTDTQAQLIAVGARSSDDVVMVGAAGKIVRGSGSQWVDQPSGTTNDLLSVWGDPNSSSVFAVGAGGTVVHYDGTAWRTETSGTTSPLRAVWGSAATNVFAVGDNGTILHFDGTSWTAQSSGTAENLRSVWGTSPNVVFAVGSRGTVLRYDGTRWAAQSTGFNMDFTDVWGTSPSDVFVSGY